MTTEVGYQFNFFMLTGDQLALPSKRAYLIGQGFLSHTNIKLERKFTS